MKVVIVVLDPTFIPPEALMSRLRTAAESAGATAQTNMMWWIEIVQSPWITLQIKKYNITSVASCSVNFDYLSALKWETGWEEEEGEEMEVKTLQMRRVGLKKKKMKSDKSNSSDEGTENVDKGGPDTWTIPVGATIALNDDSDVR